MDLQSLHHILLLFGIAIFFGLTGGRLFKKLRIPQVVGYIIIGLILGQSLLKIFDADTINNLTPFTNFALGVIGFLVGGELKYGMLKKYSKNFTAILLSEGGLAFILVTVATTLLTGKIYIGILLGALASATAPAGTVDVVWEYKGRGVLSSTIFAIIAMDDALALLLYGFSSVYAKSAMLGHELSLYHTLLEPLGELALSLGIGTAIGLIMALIFKRVNEVREKDQFLAFSIGAILIDVGIASLFHVDLILSAMALGTTLVNVSPKRSKAVFDAVSKISSPIYVVFFVLVGARLQISLLATVGALGLVYLIFRTVGKYFGAYIGSVISKAHTNVRKYLGLALFSQSGVAIGLAIAIYQTFSQLGPEGELVGSMILNIITATTFIVQLIGPPLVKYSIEKAGETWKALTEDDIMERYSVRDIMVSEPETIPESASYSDVMTRLKNSDNVFFPVVDAKGEFHGTIQLDDIRSILFEEGLEMLIKAVDMANTHASFTTPEATIRAAKDIFEYDDNDYLAVVDNKESKRLVGVVPRRKISKFIKRKLLEADFGSAS